MFPIYWSAVTTHKKLLVYFSTGVSAAVLDVLVYIWLYTVVQFPAYIATSISVALAVVYAFTINAFLNFKTSDVLIRRFLSYALISGAGLALSAVVLVLLVDMAGFNGLVIKLLTLPAVFFLQYTLNRHYSFNERPQPVSNNIEVDHAKGKQVAVVGAGFCGLTAAYRLAQSGAKVTIYELGQDVGGLAAGDMIDGFYMEKAYHFLYKTDRHILDLAKEFGLQDRIVFHRSSVGFFFNGTLYPFTTARHLLSFSPLSWFDRIRTGVLGLLLQTITDWEPLQRFSAYEWLRAFCGKQVTKIIWEPLLRGKFDRYYKDVTMSWLWGRINIRSRSRDITGSERLGYVSGGFRLITECLQAEIEKRGGTIQKGIKIEKVLRTDGGTVAVHVAGVGKEYHAVLFTTPSHVATALLSENPSLDPGYVKRASSIHYLDAVVLPFVTTQKIGDYFWYNIADERIPFLALLSTSALTGTEMFGGKHLYYIGAYVPRAHRYMSMREEDIKNEWYEGLKTMFPHFNLKRITDSRLYRFKDAQHIVERNFREDKILPYETPVDGVFLANFTQIYPDDRGTNFAVREGDVAARMVIRHLKKHAQPAFRF